MKQSSPPNTIPLHNSTEWPLGSAFPFLIGKYAQMPEKARAEYPHRHDFYEIICITEGGGEHVIDFKAYIINPVHIFIISPGQTHFWHTTKKLEGFIIGFTEDFLVLDNFQGNFTAESSVFHNLEVNPSIVVKDRNRKLTLSLVNEMLHEFTNRNPRFEFVLRSYLNIFLINLNRTSDPGISHIKDSAASVMVRQFKKLVARDFLTVRNVSGYAQHVGVSAGHLNDVVKDVTGMTPGKIIRQAVILEAKRLLAHTDMTVSQTSYALSFDDPSYFWRFFKRETGKSPESFRTSTREKYHILRSQSLSLPP